MTYPGRTFKSLLVASLAGGALLALPASGLASNSSSVGTGKKRCTLKAGADCRGIVHRWTVEHHGNLRKVDFRGADIRGADLRGADLRGAKFHGAKLHHADFRGAKLDGVNFGPKTQVPKPTSITGPRAAQQPSCYPNCDGATLTGANMSGASLVGASFLRAKVTKANLSYANLNGAVLDYTNFSHSDFTGATLRGISGDYPGFVNGTYLNADFTDAYFNGASFIGSTLTSANLTRANLVNANFSFVKWTGVILVGAKWGNTTCPDESVSNSGC